MRKKFNKTITFGILVLLIPSLLVAGFNNHNPVLVIIGSVCFFILYYFLLTVDKTINKPAVNKKVIPIKLHTASFLVSFFEVLSFIGFVKGANFASFIDFMAGMIFLSTALLLVSFYHNNLNEPKLLKKKSFYERFLLYSIAGFRWTIAVFFCFLTLGAWIYYTSVIHKLFASFICVFIIWLAIMSKTESFLLCD